MIIQTETVIQASIETCYNFARNHEILRSSIPNIPNSTIEFELEQNVKLGNKFYIDHEFLGGKLQYTTKYNVTEFVPPFKFSEELTSVFFKEFKHMHEFKELGDKTIMTDTIEYTMALGPIGRFLEKRFIDALVKEYLHKRIQLVKRKVK